MGKLDGKVAIITGAAQGMGAAHAKLFVKEGAKVVICDLNEEKGQEVADSLGNDNAIFVKLDVSSSSDWDSVVSETIDKFKRIDILVNNAGISFAKSIDTITEADYLKIFQINQLGPFLGIKAVSNYMKDQKSGSIVNVSSINGIIGGAIGYTDTKFAVRGMTKAAAIELAPFNVRVNSVHPGVIETPMIQQGDALAAIKEFEKKIPIRRIAQPDEISKLVLFLASDDSSYSTGSEFIADGGITAM